MNHAQKIRELLDRKRMSLAEVARKAGVPQSTADRMSKSLTGPIVDALKLARALDVPMDWLFDDTQDWVDLGRAKHPLGVSPEDIIAADRVWQVFVAWALRSPEPVDLRKSVLDRLQEFAERTENPAPPPKLATAPRRKAGGKGKAG